MLWSQPLALIKPISVPNESLKSDGIIQGFYDLDFEILSQLNTSRPPQVTFNLPTRSLGTLSLKLNIAQPIKDGGLVKTASGNEFEIPGVFYQGVVTGNPNSRVSLSIFENTLSGFINIDGKHLTLAPLPLKSAGDLTLFQDETTPENIGQFCATETQDFKMPEQFQRANYKDLNKCVDIYFELDYDVFQEKGSVAAATEFITHAFNEINALYQAEQIKIKISEIFVWDTPSPYLGSSSMLSLNQFQAVRPVFNGDIAHLVDFRTNNGGIAYVDVLCSALPYAYSGAQPSFEVFPTYSWTIEVIAHEIGHNLGSPHTHDCSWPGGAIDNCVPPSGPCETGETPDNGGTIMSYCHLTEHGINFNQGFGPLPGDLMRSRVSDAGCLVVCELPCLSSRDITLVQGGQTQATLGWVDIANSLSYKYQYREFGVSAWVESNSQTNRITLNGLKNNTRYEFRLATLCDGNESSFTEIFQFFTGGIPTGYCASQGENAQSEWINQVVFNGFSHTSASNNGYADFTGQIVDLPVGQNFDFELTPGFDGGILGGQTYPEYWRVWVDLNRDGTFDASELIIDSETALETTFSGTAAIPTSAALGATRMRVSMKFGQASGPCETYGEGEVEDYTAFLSNTSATSVLNKTKIGDIKIYPNPAQNILKISVENGLKVQSFQLHAMSGKVCMSGVDQPESFNLSLDEIEGGTYMLELLLENGTRITKKVLVIK